MGYEFGTKNYTPMDSMSHKSFDNQSQSPDRQLYLQGRRQMEDEAFDEAIESLQQSLKIHPRSETAELLGECYLKQHRFTEAIIPLAAAAQMNKGTRALALMADAYMALKRCDEALEAARESDHRVRTKRVATIYSRAS